MKVIFLDHDGVICLQKQFGSRYNKRPKTLLSTPDNQLPIDLRFDDFDKKAVSVLNDIIIECDCEIVVSSDWKLFANLEEMGQFYDLQGIVKRPIDFTPKFHYSNWMKDGFIDSRIPYPWDRSKELEQNRCFEIKRWLQNNPSVEKWVAVDDMDLSLHGKTNVWGLSNFVHTPKFNEGIKQTGIDKKIKSFL